ncbi:MAG: preprotein translocase subunit SecG [Acidiferrobacterales bacterium]
MRDILIAVLIVDSFSLIGLILLQRGKGADAGAAFGGGGAGGSETLFGSQGSANFLSRLTAGLAIVFFAVTMALAFLSAKRVEPGSATQSVTEQPVAPKPTPGKQVPTVPDSAPKKQTVPEVPK